MSIQKKYLRVLLRQTYKDVIDHAKHNIDYQTQEDMIVIVSYPSTAHMAYTLYLNADMLRLIKYTAVFAAAVQNF